MRTPRSQHDRPTLDYEPSSRRWRFWDDTPAVVKVFIIAMLAIAAARGAAAFIWALWGRL
jgi:hypothetical protein